LLVLRRKVETDAVHTVSLVGRRGIALSLENMAEMTSAIGTDNFGSCHSKRVVCVPSDGTGDAVKVGRPTTAGLELMVCLVQRRIATCARVDSMIRGELIVLSGEWSFGALLSQNSELVL